MFRKKQTREEQPDYVFECDALCNNCGFKWQEVFPKNHEIVQRDRQVIDMFGKDIEPLQCPNCESENIIIGERRPFEKLKRKIKVKEN